MKEPEVPIFADTPMGELPPEKFQHDKENAFLKHDEVLERLAQAVTPFKKRPLRPRDSD